MLGKNMAMVYEHDYAVYCASLPKEIKAKVIDTSKQMMENPELPGLHIEKIGDDGLFSARVDLNYRIIFAVPEGSNYMFMLYAGKHDDAYDFANHFKVEINPFTGGIQKVPRAPAVAKKDSLSNKLLSRLAALTDADMAELGIPEEFWQQLREKVFKPAHLVGFKDYISSEAYDVLEFILDGSPVDEAMALWKALTAPVIPNHVEKKELDFRKYTAEELVSIGIPLENVDKVRDIKTEEELQIVAASLPLLAQQSLYALKAGESVEDIRKATFVSAKANRTEDYEKAMKSPLTRAEFAPVCSEEVMKAFMEYPHDKWRVFLHPTQTEIVQQDYNGPARIVGGAGTGKTVVIVHRAKRLAGECAEGEKILVTTFGKTLEYDIEQRLRGICSPSEFSHIKVYTVDKISVDLAWDLLKKNIIYPEGPPNKNLKNIWLLAKKEMNITEKFSPEFCIDEWKHVIQAQKIQTEQEYLQANRIGMGKNLTEPDRRLFWELSKVYRTICEAKKIIDADLAQNMLADIIVQKYKSVIIDECQDLRAPALRMLRALAGGQHKNDMYLSGDSRQRIYPGRVSLSKCGININNRSRVLKLNYRTTEEIYDFAALLQKNYEYDNLDGEKLVKDRSNCIFHGPAPFVRKFKSYDDEMQMMIEEIKALISKSVLSTEICIMVRSNYQVYSYKKKLSDAGIKVLAVLNDSPDNKTFDGVRIMTMHRGKGMEFSYVFLPSLREGFIPEKNALKDVAGDKEKYENLVLSEVNLLAVAITRARKQVWLSYSGKPSMLIKECI